MSSTYSVMFYKQLKTDHFCDFRLQNYVCQALKCENALKPRVESSLSFQQPKIKPKPSSKPIGGRMTITKDDHRY